VPGVEGILREQLGRDVQVNDDRRAVVGEPATNDVESAHCRKLRHEGAGMSSLACVAGEVLVRMLASDARNTWAPQNGLSDAAPEVIV
jgi:hypothetical protein